MQEEEGRHTRSFDAFNHGAIRRVGNFRTKGVALTLQLKHLFTALTSEVHNLSPSRSRGERIARAGGTIDLFSHPVLSYDTGYLGSARVRQAEGGLEVQVHIS